MSNPLRNPNINYERGWFSITVHVAHNKSVVGAIVGENCELNELGKTIHETWLSHPAHTPGLKIDEFVVMPNHFHAIVAPTAVGGGYDKSSTAVGGGHERGGRDLSWVIGKFKSYTTHLYHKFKESNKCVDIGTRLWQSSFYDNLITSHGELECIRKYIRNNPRNWNNDRFGPVTTYCVGNAELLSSRLVAFVASETPAAVGRGYDKPPPRNIVGLGHCAEGEKRPVISTFTSPEEREVRAKCLRAKRPFIWVCPGGVWDPLPADIAKACEEGWAFVCSPVPSRTGVNKQRAIWCNQYVIKQAESVWVGSIRPGGSLETLLKTIKGEE